MVGLPDAAVIEVNAAQESDMSGPDKVLVIGDDMRSFLATVRSLGRQGLEVHVAPYDMSSPALLSRYIHKVHALPFYLDGGKVWLDCVTHLLVTERFKLVIPCDERSLLPLLRHEAALRAHSELAIPDQRGMDLFFDKHGTRELARSLDIPVAQGRPLTAADTARSVIDEVGLPLILKHRKSYSWPELYVRTKTTIIKTEAALADWLATNEAPPDEMLFEQMFPGIGVGVSVLCNQGAILQAFEHHRVRELDGAGYYRKSAPLDPGRLAAVTRLVAAAAYTGIAMFEFKVDPATGKWILLEVNARPWGSLPLPVALGIDFPYRLYRLLARGEATPSIAYQYDMYGRNLVTDLWQVRTVMQLTARTPGKLIGYLTNWIGEFRHLALGHEFHDGYVKDDKRPGVEEMKSFLTQLSTTARTKLMGWTPPLRTGLREKIAASLKAGTAPIRILVICDGNICRSPYAALKLEQLLAQYGNRFEIHSAGMLPRNRRASPQVAIEAAGRRDVPMLAHRSQYAFEDSVDAATIILIFDSVNLRSMTTRYPAQLDNVFFVGELLQIGGKVIEITDPVGKNGAAFDATYAQIDTALQAFAATVDATIKSPAH